MKYNKVYEEEGNFSDYQKYLNTIREKLTDNIFDFVSNPNRHDFSEMSLHDSWVKSVECICDFKKENTNIVLTLIGANFDREFKFCFQEVSQYKVSQQLSDMYRDLITYEIGIEKDHNDEEKLIFRAMFSGEETEIEIYSQKVEIEEKILEENK